MTKMTSIEEMEQLCKFASEADEWFKHHANHYSFGSTDGRTAPYIALRWGLGEDCVLVLKLDENWEPVNFRQAARYGG